jgi:hypothetical protein
MFPFPDSRHLEKDFDDQRKDKMTIPPGIRLMNVFEYLLLP